MTGAVVEVDARPPGPYRLPPAGRDGILRRRGRALVRILHHGTDPVTVVAWPTAGAVRLRAEGRTREAAGWAVERMRFAIGVDHDLAPFHRRFRRNPLLGPVIRRKPWIRPHRRPEPFEALAWAITEQLIEAEHAWRIQRSLTWRFGRRSACGQFRDAPTAAALADRSQPELQACDLSAGRSLAMIRAPVVTSGSVSAPRPAPMSSTRSPRPTSDASTMRAAQSGSSWCHPQYVRPLAVTEHHHHDHGRHG